MKSERPEILTEVIPGVRKLSCTGVRGHLVQKVFDIEVVSYLVDGILIDSGANRSRNLYASVCEKYEIAKIVNTHCHEEHCGNNGYIQGLKGVPCFVPRGVTEACWKLEIPLYRRLIFGVPTPFSATPLESTISGMELIFEVIHTPGHCDHHVSLFQRERGWLFSGDVFTSDTLDFCLAEVNGNDLIDSIQKLLALPIKVLFDGHGSVLTEPHAWLERKFRHLTMVRSRSLEMNAAGLRPKTIVRRLFGTECLAYYLSGGDFSRRNFVASFLKPQLKHAISGTRFSV